MSQPRGAEVTCFCVLCVIWSAMFLAGLAPAPSEGTPRTQVNREGLLIFASGWVTSRAQVKKGEGPRLPEHCDPVHWAKVVSCFFHLRAADNCHLYSFPFTCRKLSEVESFEKYRTKVFQILKVNQSVCVYGKMCWDLLIYIFCKLLFIFLRKLWEVENPWRISKESISDLRLYIRMC